VTVRIAWERSGAGFPLVLVHGLGYARWGWEPVAGPLAAQFEIVLLDNRGIGESEVPAGPYRVADMAEDVVRVLDEAGIARAHLVGTSLGGMIAQELALTAPGRVERLVLVCTTPGGPNAFPMPQVTAQLIATASGLDLLVALRKFVENALAPGAHEELVERILAHRVRTAQPFDAWLAQAAAGAAFDAWDRLPTLECTTLVMHGTADLVVDPRNADLLVDRIPDARLELFPGCGHLLYWEQSERFASRVGEFLS